MSSTRNTSTERLLTGDVELDARLAELAQAPANRAARAGLVKGARLAAKLIKGQIPAKYKGIRAAIGSSVKKTRDGVTTAKAGAAVGKKTASKKPPKRSSNGGVGITASNIHWFLLGTSERTQSKTGRNTGAMPAYPAVRKAMSSGNAQVMAAITEGATKQLAKEVARLARKNK